MSPPMAGSGRSDYLSNFNLSHDELKQRLVVPYSYREPIGIQEETIPMYGSHSVRVLETHRQVHSERGLKDANRRVGTRLFTIGPPRNALEANDTAKVQDSKGEPMRVFISHSSLDVEVARVLINLLRQALSLKSDEIRCTSVDGYRMPAGVSIDDTLRSEVHDATLLIGLVTPASLRSAYVMFELGARWNSGKPMIPLLASGATPGDLGGPLAGLNALDSTKDGQVHQLLEDAASYLKVSLGKTSSYASVVRELVQQSLVGNSSSAIEDEASSVPLQLSVDALNLIMEAADDGSGIISVTRTLGGLFVETNGRDFVRPRNPRSGAQWLQAVGELKSFGLVVDQNGRGEVFRVTQSGYEVADKGKSPDAGVDS